MSSKTPKLTVTQPYVVLWSEVDRNKDGVVARWLHDNILSPYDLIVMGTSSAKVEIHCDDDKLSTDAKYFGDQATLFLFSCPRDALLFKLTWGGR